MEEQGVPHDVIVRFGEIFAWRVDFFAETRPGDSFRVVWARGGDNAGDPIVAAVYRRRRAAAFFAYRYDGDYYDAAGRSLKGAFLRAPIKYSRISSYFTERRWQPILREYRPHHGVDYAAPYGTPAVSVADGRVIFDGQDGQLGRAVKIRHANGYISIYGHFSRVASAVRVGARVKQGQVVGYVGMTGLTTGPHLHFGFEANGRLIDYLKFKAKDSGRALGAADTDRFDAARREDMLLLAGATASDLAGPK